MLRDIIRNHVPLSGEVQRIQLIVTTAFNAYKYPTEAQHLSELGELSGYECLKSIRDRMIRDVNGVRILRDQPRVTPTTVNLYELLKYDPNTFGYAYAKLMTDRDLSSAERPLVKYIHDLELAYVYQRYKEIHDFIHVLLSFDVAVYDEIVVKWFEMSQLGLPSTTLSAIVGATKLSCQEFGYLTNQLPKILTMAKRSEFIMNVYFEEHFNTDLKLLRKNLRLI